MKRMFLLLVVAIPLMCPAQFSLRDRLNVFVDCSNTWCDMTFVRTEITTVNFSLDRVAADIHVLITSTNVGGGGDQFQLIFYGQNKYASINDTLRFMVSPIMTDFERRDLLVKYLKAGLAPSIAKTTAINEVSINMKSDKDSSQSNKSVVDKWNYWVYRVGIDGSFSADQNYKSLRLNGRISANRTTDKSKISIYVNGGGNRDTYYYDGTTIVDNHNAEIGHFFIKSFGSNWGAGYEINIGTNTFSNIQIDYSFGQQSSIISSRIQK